MNKRLFLIIVLLLILVPGTGIMAEVKIYLFPKVAEVPGGIRLEHIGRIEGLSGEVSRVREIGIDRELYSDRLIDRKELASLLRKNTDDVFFIYGNGVRILNNPDALDESAAVRRTILIRSGSRVRFIVVKNGIRVETVGTAMKNGAVGEIIPVQIDGCKQTWGSHRRGQCAFGKVINERDVELDL
ncbi:MAG: hypothetical protein GY754_24470 [bacterium]|nr:hypothetical protein [bacterium]